MQDPKRIINYLNKAGDPVCQDAAEMISTLLHMLLQKEKQKNLELDIKMHWAREKLKSAKLLN